MAIKASNQMTVIDLTDGYSVVLSSDAFTFTGGISAVSATQTTKTQVYAFCGSKQVPCSVGTITCPTGLSAVSDGATPSPTITITATTALTSGGTLEIPITVDSEIVIVKKFAYSIAFKGATGSTGATGNGISSISYYYAKTATSTAPAASAVTSTSIPTLDSTNKWLWQKQVIAYTNGANKTTVALIAVYGDTGATGAKGDKGDTGATGATGAAGADAITIEITSSNGIIFKNSSVATTLTAHVYKGGVEVTGNSLTALGTIKWYKDGGTTAVGTGATLTITAGDVANQATYVAQLEG